MSLCFVRNWTIGYVGHHSCKNTPKSVISKPLLFPETIKLFDSSRCVCVPICVQVGILPPELYLVSIEYLKSIETRSENLLENNDFLVFIKSFVQGQFGNLFRKNLFTQQESIKELSTTESLFTFRQHITYHSSIALTFKNETLNNKNICKLKKKPKID